MDLGIDCPVAALRNLHQPVQLSLLYADVVAEEVGVTHQVILLVPARTGDARTSALERREAGIVKLRRQVVRPRLMSRRLSPAARQQVPGLCA